MLTGHLPAEPRVGRAQPGGGVLGLSRCVGQGGVQMGCINPCSELRALSAGKSWWSNVSEFKNVFSKNTIWKTAAQGVVRVPDPFLGFKRIPWSTWHIENAR